MQLSLNASIVVAVIVMRFVIHATPDMFPKEQMIVVHCFIFSVVTTSWIIERTFTHRFNEASDWDKQEQTDESYLIYLNAGNTLHRSYAVYQTADALMILFMLYMVHSFSNFRGMRYDPVTKQFVPILSMFQNTRAMEESLNDRVISDKKRDAIKRVLDYDEAKELFRESVVEASIVDSFI